MGNKTRDMKKWYDINISFDNGSSEMFTKVPVDCVCTIERCIGENSHAIYFETKRHGRVTIFSKRILFVQKFRKGEWRLDG